MKRRYFSAATVLLVVVVSTGAGAAPASRRNSEKRLDEPRDVISRVVKIIKKFVPTTLEDVIVTPKP
jgi:hypothetical protein